MMMFLAFFIDQIQLANCQKFKKILEKRFRLSYVWKKFACQLEEHFFDNWDQFYGAITGDFIVRSEFIESG